MYWNKQNKGGMEAKASLEGGMDLRILVQRTYTDHIHQCIGSKKNCPLNNDHYLKPNCEFTLDCRSSGKLINKWVFEVMFLQQLEVNLYLKLKQIEQVFAYNLKSNQ